MVETSFVGIRGHGHDSKNTSPRALLKTAMRVDEEGCNAKNEKYVVVIVILPEHDDLVHTLVLACPHAEI